MPAKKPDTPERFEHAIAELERIVAAMESGELPLEESLAQYQRGIQLLRDCRARLDTAEQQVRILEGEAMQSFRDDTGEKC